jgi:uncharacterized damage-inducible protein DinB
MKGKAYFELMATYNQWMNARLYEAASQLSAAELGRDCGAFFDSIIGTLNHILVGDTLWLKRFADHQVHFPALDYVRNLESPDSLDAPLYSDFRGLRTARERLDRAILAFTRELTEEALSFSLSYNSMKGQPFTKNFGSLLLHFFNHQTHHRGQATTLLSQAGIDVGVTDLLASIPDE